MKVDGLQIFSCASGVAGFGMFAGTTILSGSTIAVIAKIALGILAGGAIVAASPLLGKIAAGFLIVGIAAIVALCVYTVFKQVILYAIGNREFCGDPDPLEDDPETVSTSSFDNPSKEEALPNRTWGVFFYERAQRLWGQDPEELGFKEAQGLSPERLNRPIDEDDDGQSIGGDIESEEVEDHKFRNDRLSPQEFAAFIAENDRGEEIV